MGFIEKFRKTYAHQKAVAKIILIYDNRYYKFVVYGVALLMTSCLYYGWQQFSQMLYYGGTYGWLCNSNVDKDGTCKEQREKVAALYQICLCSEFSGAMLAGVLYDNIGPMLTGLVGESIFLIGLLILASSNKSAALVVISMILTAGAVNLVAFPTLVLADFFPNRTGFIMAYTLAGQLSAAVIPVIIEKLWSANRHWTLFKVIGVYAIICFPIAANFILALPFKHVIVVKTNKDEKKIIDDDETNELMKTNVEKPCEIQEREGKTECRQLLREMITIEFIIFTVYYIAQLMQLGYYPPTVRSQYGDDVADIQGYIVPFAALVSPLAGHLADMIGSIQMCVAVNMAVTVIFGICLSPNPKIQHINSVLYMLASSFVYTTKFVYFHEIFHESNFGLLCGICSTLSGLLGLLNMLILEDDYPLTCKIYLGFCFFNFALIAILLLRKIWGLSDHKNLGKKWEAPPPLKDDNLLVSVQD